MASRGKLFYRLLEQAVSIDALTYNDIIKVKEHSYMVEKIDKDQIIYSKQELLDERDNEYWVNASTEEKLQTITYLRECFYGKEATTGRLQRIYTMSKLK